MKVCVLYSADLVTGIISTNNVELQQKWIDANIYHTWKNYEVDGNIDRINELIEIETKRKEERNADSTSSTNSSS